MKFKKWLLELAELVDATRVFPRLFCGAYGYMAFHAFVWFVGLDNPTMPQATFASAVLAMCGPILRWYMQTGRDWSGRHHGGFYDGGFDGFPGGGFGGFGGDFPHAGGPRMGGGYPAYPGGPYGRYPADVGGGQYRGDFGGEFVGPPYPGPRPPR